jgi:diguanylate cyclase (GGDEF)-like protein
VRRKKDPVGEGSTSSSPTDPSTSPPDRADGGHVLRSVIGSTGVRTWLALVVLVPTITAVALGSWSAKTQAASRSEALAAQSSSLELDTLIAARAALTNEETPTSAIVYAKGFGINQVELDRLMQTNFKVELTAARSEVNRQKIFHGSGELAAYDSQLTALRQSVNDGTSSFGQVLAGFASIDAAIDTRFSNDVATMTKAAEGLASGAIITRIDAVRSAFAALRAGSNQLTLAPQILVGTTKTPPVADLIAETTRWQMATHGYPDQLGPRAAAVWRALVTSPETSRFNSDIQLAISIGLRGATPPFDANPALGTNFFKAELAAATSQLHLVLAASSDLRTATADQAAGASRVLLFDLIGLFWAVCVGIGGMLLLGRSIGRPVARIAEASRGVRAGQFDQAALCVSGPRELSLASAVFNEMTSTLHAVQTRVVALSKGDFEDPSLQDPLPGDVGCALQDAVTTLYESMQTNEMQKELLEQRATHDALTGMLNRGAALDALQRDLDRALRGEEALQLLFIDIDGLKGINDSYGHGAGDLVLRAIARAFELTTRSSDVVARIGGDEFLVARLGEGDSAAVLQLANRILRQLSTTVAVVDDHRIPIRCSVGIATSEPSDVRIDSVMKRADSALYEAKRCGGSQAVVYGSDLRSCPQAIEALDSYYLSMS